MDYTKLQDSGYKVYPYRYVIVIMFALVQMMTSVLLSTLNPIAKFLTEIYDTSSIVVNLGALLFTLMHPIFTFPAAYVIDTYGTKAGIIVGSICGILGVSLRLLVNESFAWVIIGQTMAGIGRPFILNCQAKISANWFSKQSRGQITQLLTLILNISLILGMIIPSVIFGNYTPDGNIEPDGHDNYEQGRSLTFNLMLLQAIMGYVCFGANLFFQRNSPPTPPSEAGQIIRLPFKQSIQSMLKNTNYIKLWFAFGCYFGIFNGISITMSYMLKPWFEQILPTAVSLVGGTPIISGIIGVMIIGPLQRKSGIYKKWVIMCMAGSMLAIALFYPVLLTDSLVMVCLVSAFNALFLIPLVPIMLELGCELVFPVGEGTAVGLLFAMGNFSGFVFGAILSVMVTGDSKGQTAGGLGFCFGIFLIGFLMVYLLKEQLNRKDAQSQRSLLRESTILSSSSNQLEADVSRKENQQNQKKVSQVGNN